MRSASLTCARSLKKTGGRFYRADDLRQVGPAFEAITSELGVHYSLGYYSKHSANADAERAIKVKVRYPNMVVRTRDSFSTSSVAQKISRRFTRDADID